MDNLPQPLTIPPIIQKHSEYLKMLESRKNDFSKTPLKWSDESLITQDQLDTFAAMYQPNFDYKNLKLYEIIEIAHFHSYFQMNLPNQPLENAIYENILSNKFTQEQIKDLPSELLHNPISLFAKTQQLDAQLLKPYSNYLLKNKTTIIKNTQQHSIEKLLFSNDATKIYGAFDIQWFTPGFPPFTLLLIKNNQHTIQQEINIRPTKDGYWVDDMIIHQNGLYAITEHYDDSQYGHQSSFGILNLTSGKTTALWDILKISKNTNHVCCFGKEFDKNVLYACVNNNKKLILYSISLDDNYEKKEIAILENPSGEKIVTTGSNKDGNCIVIATKRALFIVRDLNKNKIIEEIIMDINNHVIKKLSINNSGTLVCIITGDYKNYELDKPVHVYLCNLAEFNKTTYSNTTTFVASILNDCTHTWIEITDKIYQTINIQNLPNKSPKPYQKLCLTNIDNLTWNHDDSLLFLECYYRYNTFGSSNHVGKQYAFICPSTYNSWGEDAIHEDKSKINSADNEKIMIDDSSSWFPQTKLTNWCDENITNALSYLNEKNLFGQKSYHEKLLGLILLNEILQQQDNIHQLDLKKTEIYKEYIPNVIKSILTTTRTILLSEKNDSRIKKIHKTLYRWYIYSKNFLYHHRESLLYSLATIATLISLIYGYRH